MPPPPSARRTRRPSPSDKAPTEPNGLSSDSHSTTSNETFYSLCPHLAHSSTQNGSVGPPWNRVDALLQRDFARGQQDGNLSLARKVELYGDKLEEKFQEYEEKLLCRDEELLLKGRELQRTNPLQTTPSFCDAEKAPFLAVLWLT